MLSIRMDDELTSRVEEAVRDGLAPDASTLINKALTEFFFRMDAGFCANGRQQPPGAWSQEQLRAASPDIVHTVEERRSEVWRPIPDVPGYEISNLGQFRSPFGRILKLQRNTGLYLQACLRTDGQN